MTIVLSRMRLVVVFTLLLASLCSSPLVLAKGKGPVGVWPASERYALVADSSLPGLVLVDLHTGVARERLPTPKGRPVGVASCANCRFVFISGGKGNYQLLHLQDTVSHLLRAQGRLGLGDARLEVLDVGTAKGRMTDGRMVLVSDDGQTAFVASSEDHAVVRMDLSSPSQAEELFYDRKAKPFGLNWDRNGDLLVTMHKDHILRMSVRGKLSAVYDVKAAGCPGARELDPNLRAAIDDPLHEGSLLVLASNPRSYDAVVWRLDRDAQGKLSCVSVAGKLGREPGWIDASGEAVEFSRPHYFTLRPNSQPAQLILTDIDNRALRLLDLSTYVTSSVMYNSIQDAPAASQQANRSKSSCAELKWATTSLVHASGEFQYCVSLPQAHDGQLTHAQAQAQCNAQGARLCAPAELLSAGVIPDSRAWTAAECSSCWQRRAEEPCVAGPDHKTHGLVHAHKDFVQRWHSGHALVTAAITNAPAAAVCRPVDDSLRAAAPCCADVWTAPGKNVPDTNDVGSR
jgi:hypothetical protein